MQLILLSSILVLPLFSLLFYYFNRKYKIWGPTNLPPGSFGWPFIGETLDFLKTPESFAEDRMKKHHAQIFKTSLLGEPMAVLCGQAGNKFLFSNENKLVIGWWPTSVRNLFPSSIVTLVGSDVKRMRGLLMAFLKPEALRRYVGTIDAVTRQHMEIEWENKEEVKVFPLVKTYAFALACYLFTSIEDPDQVSMLGKEFKVLLKGIIELPLNFPGTRYYRAARAAEAIRKELRVIIRQRRVALAEKKASPTQDLLSHLLVTADENGRYLTENEIVNNILVLLFAGHDTSSCAITLIIKYLAEMPDVYNKILQEQTEISKSKGGEGLLDWEDIQKMRYSWNVANEVMRLSPPITGAFREAIADFTYAGFTIPKGWKLYWTGTSTHKDLDYFSEPEKFDPSRFEGQGPPPYAFVPFGGGPRMCPGKEFARLQILVYLHNVVKRFRWVLVFPNEKIKFDPLPTPVEGLPIRLQPH